MTWLENLEQTWRGMTAGIWKIGEGGTHGRLISTDPFFGDIAHLCVGDDELVPELIANSDGLVSLANMRFEILALIRTCETYRELVQAGEQPTFGALISSLTALRAAAEKSYPQVTP